MTSIPYTPGHSKIFGKILRPLVDIQIYSSIIGRWIMIKEVLADTGADISILPRAIGESIVGDATTGEYIEIKGVVPNSVLTAFIHTLKIKLLEKTFTTKVAIADSNDVPPILGRYLALDLFKAKFDKGQKLELE
jgi:hypothetical protein